MSINKPRYYNRITGKAIAKIQIEFTINDEDILFALSTLLDYEKAKNITRQDVINRIKQDKKEFGEYGQFDYGIDFKTYFLDRKPFTALDFKNYGVRAVNDFDTYNIEEDNYKEKAYKKIIKIGTDLFPEYFKNMTGLKLKK